MTALTAWWDGHRVGRITAGATTIDHFVYDEAWCRDGRAISCSLPLTGAGEATQRQGASFFTNLLPEGNARDRLVRRLGIADDDFVLLARLGGDCAGALSLWPDDASPPVRGDGTRVLTEQELLEAIRLGVGNLLAGGNGDSDAAPRLSLAGAQDKLPVRVETRDRQQPRLLLPQGDTASTHILKLPVNDLRHVPLYECYTTFIASKLGLPVAEIVPLRIGEHWCSLGTRYDRAQQGGSVMRIHQEDFCQATGRARSAKYYVDSGAHAGLVADVLRRHANAPAADLRALLNWQVFNVLAGNTDGHLKNLSLLADPRGGWQLAPFYDLVCVLAIEGVSHRLALPVGDAQDPQMLARPHWEAFAKQTGTGPAAVFDAIATQAGALHDHLDAWHAEFQALHGEFPELQRPYRVLRKQADKALRDWTR